MQGHAATRLNTFQGRALQSERQAWRRLKEDVPICCGRRKAFQIGDTIERKLCQPASVAPFFTIEKGV
ncbi:hypothetical protein ACFSZS_10840 [Seohaeicola zhoushanensis]